MLHHLRKRSPLFFGILLLFIGIIVSEHWQLYDRIAHFDKVLHVLGGVAVAWMAMATLQNDIGDLAWFKQALIVVAVACLIGVVWEFAEYASNFTRHTYPLWYHYFHGGDLADTLGDLAADVSGGAVFALWALYKERN